MNNNMFNANDDNKNINLFNEQGNNKSNLLDYNEQNDSGSNKFINKLFNENNILNIKVNNNMLKLYYIRLNK